MTYALFRKSLAILPNYFHSWGWMAQRFTLSIAFLWMSFPVNEHVSSWHFPIFPLPLFHSPFSVCFNPQMKLLWWRKQKCSGIALNNQRIREKIIFACVSEKQSSTFLSKKRSKIEGEAHAETIPIPSTSLELCSIDSITPPSHKCNSTSTFQHQVDSESS